MVQFNMESIFNKMTKAYMQNEMCLNIEVYENRINQFSYEFKEFFGKLGNLLLQTDDVAMLKKYTLLLLEEFKIEESLHPKTYDTAVVLTNAFRSYKKGGLLALYHHTASDQWEELPVIRKSLYSEMRQSDQNVYNSLSEKVTIYRGTSFEEYESKQYSQSWTMDINKAHEFAYDLGSREKYNNSRRVVMENQILKQDIYAYIDDVNEKCCIVNVESLISNSSLESEKFISSEDNTDKNLSQGMPQ